MLSNRAGLSVVLLLLVCCGCGGMRAAGPAGTSLVCRQADRDSGLDDRRQAAAVCGLKWLLDSREVIPPDYGLMLYRQLYRAVADERLAAELLAAIREKEVLRQPAVTDIDKADPRYRNWFVLRGFVEELIRCKCAGEPYLQGAAQVLDLLRAYWSEIFPASMILSQKLVGAYLLEQIGAVNKNFYEVQVAELRAQRPCDGPVMEADCYYHLYGLTHIVFTAAQYYGRYPDPAGYQVEIAQMRRAVDAYFGAAQLSGQMLDIAAEALICYKLLRVPLDEPAEALVHRILERQNSDGSWGAGEQFTSARVHHTFVATMAMLDFAQPFRGPGIHCDYSRLAR
ncbi:MAG: hypothetical protein GY868_21900 [Deltaproteobacteria bacterium]|nr:hypothetical protein [Deltaproteobacteria bacterium]